MKKILFVCSGNTCRSPLAEGIARKVFSGNIGQVSSAGTSALEGLPASSLAIEVAKDNSIDLSNHHSRLLNRTRVKDADLIVTMTAKHRETVEVIEPAALRYTFSLTEFCGDVEGDVPDPIGMGREGYEKVFALIERCVKKMKGKLEGFDSWKD